MSKREYLKKIIEWYFKAGIVGKRKGVLDEFCANCGYNRKYAIRLLNQQRRELKPGARGGAPRSSMMAWCPMYCTSSGKHQDIYAQGGLR